MEAAARLGGRVRTDTTWGVPVDLGAQWIHGVSGNPLTAMTRSGTLATLQPDDQESVSFDRAGRRLWDADVDSIGLDTASGRWLEWVNLAKIVNRPVLAAYSAGTPARKISTWTDDRVIRDAVNELRRARF